ncbi:DUF177 domain-containing protein [Adhaeribacter soli]|uniref:DUF177 domain-containing protein n=1 Tax=Adhaeribacter soli TaxID=2607655 RepID=A0A5N1JBE5_9BACT|nr:DUF177 domain-containing protein [Adhaeribacter soli]
MKALHPYDIELVQLSNKQHEFDYELDDRFFGLFDQTLVNGGHLKAHVTLDKSELLLNFTFHIAGTLRLTCDRSLEEFDYPIDTTQKLHVRFGNEEVELDENVLQILHGAQKINIAQHLFDYIGLSVPIKKLCPQFLEEDENAVTDEDENILIYSSSTAPETDEDDDDEGPVDPRWDALKKIK